MTVTNPFPKLVSPANDFALIVGPIRGVDPSDATVKLYGGASIDAWWADAAQSDTPLGNVTGSFSQLGSSARYVVSFEASDMTAALNGLTEGSLVYLVLRGSGDFRAVIGFRYATARQIA